MNTGLWKMESGIAAARRPGMTARCAGRWQLTLAALFGGVFLFGAGQLLGMDDRLVDRAAGGAEIGKLAVIAIALQDVHGRDRLAADLIGGGALEDRPVHPPRLGLLLDIVETAIDHRVEGIELALDFSARRATVAPGRSAASSSTLIATPAAVTAVPVARAPAALVRT